MKKGKFIVFEGLDGSGSSTHSDLIVKRLNAKGLKTILSKEPTNNLIGGLIRGILTKEWEISPNGLQLLFSADRAHHLERFIIPALNNGTNVILDRYMYSTIAYGTADGADKKWLLELNKYFLVPDKVFFIKVSPQECIRRIGRDRGNFELFEETEKLRKVMNEYEKLAEDNSNFLTLDNERDKNLVNDEIFDEVLKLIER